MTHFLIKLTDKLLWKTDLVFLFAFMKNIIFIKFVDHKCYEKRVDLRQIHNIFDISNLIKISTNLAELILFIENSLLFFSWIAFLLVIVWFEELNTINIEINAPCGSVLFIHWNCYLFLTWFFLWLFPRKQEVYVNDVWTVVGNCVEFYTSYIMLYVCNATDVWFFSLFCLQNENKNKIIIMHLNAHWKPIFKYK